MALDQTELSQIISAVLAALKTDGVAPKATASAKPADLLAQRDRQLLNTFLRRGFKNTVLMNRADPKAEFNVRPYRGWIELGRRVRKGERGVRGLFHVDQTDVIAPASPPKGKAKLTVAKSQLPLV